jgi:hypothetical protein
MSWLQMYQESSVAPGAPNGGSALFFSLCEIYQFVRPSAVGLRGRKPEHERHALARISAPDSSTSTSQGHNPSRVDLELDRISPPVCGFVSKTRYLRKVHKTGRQPSILMGVPQYPTLDAPHIVTRGVTRSHATGHRDRDMDDKQGHRGRSHGCNNDKYSPPCWHQWQSPAQL